MPNKNLINQLTVRSLVPDLRSKSNQSISKLFHNREKIGMQEKIKLNRFMVLNNISFFDKHEFRFNLLLLLHSQKKYQKDDDIYNEMLSLAEVILKESVSKKLFNKMYDETRFILSELKAVKNIPEENK